jgi:hypothetical protein
MAIDTHDDEAAARVLLTAAQTDISPVAQKLRAGRRLMVYLFIVYLAVAPVFFCLSIWRFIQALQSGNWLPFWVAAFGVVVFFVPPLALAFYDPLANRNSAVAYICLIEVIASGDETLAPTVPLSKAADTPSQKMKYVQVIGELSSARMAYTLIIQFASIGLVLFLVVWASRLWPVQAPDLDIQAYLLQT